MIRYEENEYTAITDRSCKKHPKIFISSHQAIDLSICTATIATTSWADSLSDISMKCTIELPTIETPNAVRSSNPQILTSVTQSSMIHRVNTELTY